MLQHAFKEWAVICQALAEGRQVMVLRKGGIAEHDDRFTVEHERFWLYPTYAHQQRAGVVADAAPLLARAESARPPDDVVRITQFAEVTAIYRIHQLDTALSLAGQHIWSEEVVRQRFAYREPGLFVLAVRVWNLPAPAELAVTAEYAGCRSWVELDHPLPTAGADPAVAEAEYDDRCATLADLLRARADR